MLTAWWEETKGGTGRLEYLSFLPSPPEVLPLSYHVLPVYFASVT